MIGGTTFLMNTTLFPIENIGLLRIVRFIKFENFIISVFRSFTEEKD